MSDLNLDDMKKAYGLKEPITFKATIVFYPSGENGLLATLAEAKRVIESGEYELDFVMPFGQEPVIIIKEEVVEGCLGQ